MMRTEEKKKVGTLVLEKSVQRLCGKEKQGS